MQTRRRTAFSLIEALVALSITAMAGSVLLLATEGVLKTTNDAVDQTIAQGMATQLIDEVLGARYSATNDAYETTLSASSWERSGTGRSRYNDTDDYNDFEASPPTDVYGNSLGQGESSGSLRPPVLRSTITEFGDWRQRIRVYYVNPANPSIEHPDSNPTDYRAVEVTIERTENNGSIRPLATMRRVFCYVPIP